MCCCQQLQQANVLSRRDEPVSQVLRYAVRVQSFGYSPENSFVSSPANGSLAQVNVRYSPPVTRLLLRMSDMYVGCKA